MRLRGPSLPAHTGPIRARPSARASVLRGGCNPQAPAPAADVSVGRLPPEMPVSVSGATPLPVGCGLGGLPWEGSPPSPAGCQAGGSRCRGSPRPRPRTSTREEHEGSIHNGWQPEGHTAPRRETSTEGSGLAGWWRAGVGSVGTAGCEEGRCTGQSGPQNRGGRPVMGAGGEGTRGDVWGVRGAQVGCSCPGRRRAGSRTAAFTPHLPEGPSLTSPSCFLCPPSPYLPQTLPDGPLPPAARLPLMEACLWGFQAASSGSEETGVASEHAQPGRAALSPSVIPQPADLRRRPGTRHWTGRRVARLTLGPAVCPAPGGPRGQRPDLYSSPTSILLPTAPPSLPLDSKMQVRAGCSLSTTMSHGPQHPRDRA